MPTIVQRSEGRATLIPRGELTIYAASEFKANLEEAFAGSESLEIDLSEVSEMDTAGLQLLLAAEREARSSGKTLALKGHGETVLQVFELCDVAGYFGDPAGIPK